MWYGFFKCGIMKNLLFIFLLIPLCLFGQKDNFSLGQLEGNPQDVEKICYSNGTDTLEGWKIHSYDIIEGYGFTIIDVDGNEVLGANQIDSYLCDACQTTVLAVEPKYDYVNDSGNEQVYTLFSKLGPPHPDAGSYPGTFTYIGNVTGGTHPNLGFEINGWRVYAACATTFPSTDSNNHDWLLGSPDDFNTVTFTRTNQDPVCSNSGEGGCTAIQQIKEKDCDGNETYRYVIEDNGSLINYEPVGEVLNECKRTELTVLCKDICWNGVKIPFEYAVSDDGIYAWFKNLNTQEFIIGVPDFGEDCPPLDCETETFTLCSDGDYTEEGISDGDELIVVIKTCTDGSSNIESLALLSNPTTSLQIPNGITFQACTNEIETELINCIVDSDGNQWNEILIDGTTLAYQNVDTKAFGTPVGNPSEWTQCQDATEIVSTLPQRHCIQIGENTLEAYIHINSDKTICASSITGTDTYQQGEFSIIPCCGEDATETLYQNGFTVTRPTDTPNTGWNNQLITGSTPLVGDFKLCFTPNAETGDTPNMIGLNSDPNTNSSYTSIDCALYLYNANATYLLREYRNGAFSGQLSNTSWVGQEICWERIGGNVFISQGGVVLNSGNPCPIGTGTVFLDDSHYFAAGFWGTGSITYSDFVLTSSTDEGITTVEDCQKQDEISILEQIASRIELADVIYCDYNGADAEIRYYNDDTRKIYNRVTGVEITSPDFNLLNCSSGNSVTLNKTFEDERIVFAEGYGYNNTTEGTYRATVTNTANGIYSVSFSSPHPDGANYGIEYGAEEDANRDVPKVWTRRGTKTANGFEFEVTIDDNGQGADTRNDAGWSFVVHYDSSFLKDVTAN